MHGNVWEWTEDRWHDTLASVPADGSSWVEGGDATVRVLRGGSWSSITADARSAKRFSFIQTGRRNDVGFRIVMKPDGGS
jgi:formylglycine-generating enzyme required for sulfatase activity